MSKTVLPTAFGLGSVLDCGTVTQLVSARHQYEDGSDSDSDGRSNHQPNISWMHFQMFCMGTSPGEELLWIWEIFLIFWVVFFCCCHRLAFSVMHKIIFSRSFQLILVVFLLLLFVFVFFTEGLFVEVVACWCLRFSLGPYCSRFSPRTHTNTHAVGPTRLHSFAAAASVVTMEILFIT